MLKVRELFVDTNILVYFSNSLSPWNSIATQTLQDARQLGVDLIVSPQIMREYLASATRESLLGSGPPLLDIIQNFQYFRSDFRVVDDNMNILSNLAGLVQTFPMGGKQIHDTNIVATMQFYGITHVLTHNTKHFNRFASLITVVPLQANNLK